jgi:hypothetical protein
MSDEQTDDRVDAKEAAAAAFVAALGELTNPGKDSKATVQTKTGGSYAYEYAGLDSILDGVRPVLARHGLALSQPFGVDPNGLVTVRTRVLHERGVAIEGDPISRVVEGGPQEVGSFVDDALRDLVKAPPSAKLGQYAQGWLDKRAAEAAEQAPPLPEMGQPEFEAPSGSGE